MSTHKLGAALRRSATLIAASALLLGTGAGAAFAFDSGGTPAATGPDNIEWTGQGSNAVSPNGTGACSASQEPNGQPANTPYLYWVFTTDGGSVNTTDHTNNQPLPFIVLTDNGNPQPPVNFDSSSSSNSVKFITPYFDPTNPGPSGLQAQAFFNVTATGSGSWNLVISHGCAPPAIVQAQPPTVTKTANAAYTTTTNWNVQKTTSTPQLSGAPGTTVTASYHVVVTGTTSNGDVHVSGDIYVSNPNTQAISLNGGSVVDTLNGDGNESCQLTNGPPDHLNPASGGQPGITDIPYTCTIPASSFDPSQTLTNTVTVNWADQMLDPTTHLAAGQAQFTTQPIDVQQNLVDNCITVKDPQAPNPPLPAQVCTGDLDQNGQKSFDYTVDYTTPSGQNAGTCDTHVNQVDIYANDANNTDLGHDNASVSVCSGADLVVTKDAQPTFTRTYQWGLNKAVLNGPVIKSTDGTSTANYELTVTHDQGTDSNWLVTGKIHVHNPNAWEDVSLTNLADAIDNGGTCTVDGSPGLKIPAGQTVDYNYQCVYDNPPTQSDFTNTATATWDATAASTADGSAQGTATGNFDTPTTVVNGQVSIDDPQAPHPPAPWVVNATDPSPTTIDYSVQRSGDPAGQCTPHQNTATLTGDQGYTQTANASVTVCVGADLTVTKTATPSFNRIYSWQINKTVNGGPSVSLVDGGTVNYAVKVDQTGVQDYGWMVTGKITVTNPNQWNDPITLTNLTDNLKSGDPNASCQLDSPGLTAANSVIAPNSSQSYSYTCGYSQAPASSSDTNVATASWDANAASTPDGSASGNADFAFTTPTNLINKTIHVTDSQGGALGTVTANDSQPFATHTFTYSKTFGTPASGCPVTVNIATITETGQNAQASVTNCTLGALTMGFWHNQNGQAIIGSAALGSPLANYIHTFAPFADYPQKTGQTVAQYFTAVFNAANAAGSGAPMLKAQMLATALNVWFSDPALGGNKINAPAPIGGVSVNVSQWAAAFGNPSGDITVSQMLTIASSNWDGGNPYGGGSSGKATTSLAIGAFTAVNQSQITS